MSTVHNRPTSSTVLPEHQSPADPFSVPGAQLTWRRGVIEPNRAHIQETEDGSPRTILTNHGQTAIAICQAWLTGTPIAEDQLAKHGLQRCSACANYCQYLPAIRPPGGAPDAE